MTSFLAMARTSNSLLPLRRSMAMSSASERADGPRACRRSWGRSFRVIWESFMGRGEVLFILGKVEGGSMKK